jgi:hypothetical protein
LSYLSLFRAGGLRPRSLVVPFRFGYFVSLFWLRRSGGNDAPERTIYFEVLFFLEVVSRFSLASR